MNVPKLRFPEFCGEWEESELGKYAEEVSRINPVSNAPIMMISAASGFILQSNKYSKEMAGQSLKKYIELHLGEFAYNHGASKIKKYGACFSLDIEKARIPFVYHCFKLNTGNTKFFAYLLNRNELDSELARYISSSARMDGLLNISYSDYMKIKINVPSLPEQQKIADFLSTVDSIIASETKILNALQKKKKALMQKLFSQQLRFKADDGSEFPEWVEKKLGDCVINISSGKNKNKSATGNYPVYGSMGIIGYTENYKYEKDCILIARVGANAGALNIAVGKYDVSDNTLILNLQKNEILKFYYYRLMFMNLNKLNYGTGQPLVTSGMLQKLDINLPCKEEQQKIADCLSGLDNLIQNQQKIVTKWQQRKKGLLQKMFV